MSAFLGPIHTWLYRKIKLQDRLTEAILRWEEEHHAGSPLKGYLAERYGVLEDAPLEEVVDGSNIHGWLQSRISLVENRLAFVVTMLLKESPEALAELVSVSRQFGGEMAVAPTLSVKEAYKFLEDTLLSGMPCDRVNQVLEEEELRIRWQETCEIHAPYWQQVGGDAANFYAIRNAWTEGMFTGSGITYTVLAPGEYELRRGQN